MFSEKNQEKLKALREGAKLVEDGVNSNYTTMDDISRVFRVHPDLLNRIAKGVLKAVCGYRGDPRITPSVHQAAKLVWD